MASTWTHKFIASKPFSGYGGNRMITVTAGLQFIPGNRAAYFSVTAEIRRPGARDCDACGCMHEDVLASWPELAPVVALHLCNEDGLPMHSGENGWYFLAGYFAPRAAVSTTLDDLKLFRYTYGNTEQHIGKEYRHPTPDECLQTFAEHCRISVDDARVLAICWENVDDWTWTRRQFSEWLTTQHARYQDEARAAIALLDTLIAESGK